MPISGFPQIALGALSPRQFFFRHGVDEASRILYYSANIR